MTDPIDRQAATGTSRPRGRRWLVGAALVGAFIAGGLSLPVIAASAQDAMTSPMMGSAGHGAMHAQAMAHVQQMLDKVNATPEQRAKIEAILHAGLASMRGLHGDMASTHARLHQLLTAPTIDRQALEALRASQIASFDQASRKMVDAMADAAEVLTPAQRAVLAKSMSTPMSH
jgi:Spy/CpxP family protein refolding chaperone